MFVTDKEMLPETIVAPWQTLPRGNRLRLTPLDIMIDIDEVLVPLIDSIHEIAYTRGLHDNSLPMAAWQGWTQYGCSEEEYWELWDHFAESGGYRYTPPIPGSVEALRRLYWEGHTIHLVTARGFMKNAERIRGWTPEWIEEFAVPHHSLTFAQDKVAAQGLLGVRFDYALDDSPRNFAALANDGIKTYLMTHPHNADLPLRPRVNTVGEFVDKILEENE